VTKPAFRCAIGSKLAATVASKTAAAVQPMNSVSRRSAGGYFRPTRCEEQTGERTVRSCRSGHQSRNCPAQHSRQDWCRPATITPTTTRGPRESELHQVMMGVKHHQLSTISNVASSPRRRMPVGCARPSISMPSNAYCCRATPRDASPCGFSRRGIGTLRPMGRSSPRARS
jgi:hypothetical protein